MWTVGSFTSAGPVDAEGGWQDSVSRLHGSLRVRPRHDGVFAGDLAWAVSDQYRVVAWKGAPERLTRGRAELRRDPQPLFEIITPLKGELVLEYANRRLVLGPGELALVDLDGPVACEHSHAAEALCLVVPHETAQARLTAGHLPGPVDAKSGMAFVGVQMLTAIAEEAEHLGSHGFDAACDRLLELTVLALGGADSSSTDHVVETEMAIRRHVRRHVSDPGLCGQDVADALGWSLRHVQIVLRRSGTTPSDLIRHERLALARLLLEDPRRARLSIGRIATMCGFASHTVFARSFRAEFGVRPQDVRARAVDKLA